MKKTLSKKSRDTVPLNNTAKLLPSFPLSLSVGAAACGVSWPVVTGAIFNQGDISRGLL
jgi:hypothetical protein